MVTKRLYLVVSLCLAIALMVGCNLSGGTRVVSVNPPVITTSISSQASTATAQANKGAYIGTGIYPARYEVGNPSGYIKELTIDMEFQIYNGLPYPSPIKLYLAQPSASTMKKRIGFVYWGDTAGCVSIIDDGQYIPAYGSKTVTVRLYVPKEMTPPSRWIFQVAYMNTGQLWGVYRQTVGDNFVFYPACFTVEQLGDQWQEMSYLTWGNSPRLMIRASYGAPPETISDGRLVYLGLGEQVIRKWDKGDGTLLDRQYTLFRVTDNQVLGPGSEAMLFYKAWIEHRGPDGNPDGTWDIIGQSVTVAEVRAEVQVTMR